MIIDIIRNGELVSILILDAEDGRTQSSYVIVINKKKRQRSVEYCCCPNTNTAGTCL